ncbi:MAG: hypothetical protein ACFB12_15925 [Leptolyngbyaceae cyanobacterium]
MTFSFMNSDIMSISGSRSVMWHLLNVMQNGLRKSMLEQSQNPANDQNLHEAAARFGT